MLIGNIFSNVRRALYEGVVHYPIASHHVYYSHWGTTHIEHTHEEVEAIIAAVERVRARWPYLIVPLFPAKPKPEAIDQPLWVIDSTVVRKQCEIDSSFLIELGDVAENLTSKLGL